MDFSFLNKLVALAAFASTSFGATWYASPTGSGGNGSIGNPWSLYAALKSASIQPGDTLYLRGGTYNGPGFISNLAGTALNYVTVTSYPGEWALVTDGNAQTLQTTLTSGTTTGVVITGSDEWPQGYPHTISLLVDSEWIKLSSKTGANTWTILRGWNGTTAASHSIGAPVYIHEDFIYHYGSYVSFKDFEIASTYTQSRVVNSDGNGGVTTNWLGSGLDLNVPGVGNKAINLVVHDVGHPGIGLWTQGDGGEVNGCLIWGCGYYDESLSYHEYRGSGIYTQNDTGHAVIKNSYWAKNLTEAMHIYGQGANINGFRVSYNSMLMNGSPSVLQNGGGGNPANDNALWTNYFGMNGMLIGYTTRTNTLLSLKGNVSIFSTGWSVSHYISGEVTGNTWFYTKTAGDDLLDFSCPESTRAALTFTWDGNFYYPTSNLNMFGYNTSDVTAKSSINAGSVYFNSDTTFSWTNWTTWDWNSTYAASWPSQTNVFVHQYDYDSNRWNITVVNTSITTNIILSLTGLGFGAYDVYTLIDLQNWPVTVSAGSSGAGTLSIPINLTAYRTIIGESTNVARFNLHSNSTNNLAFNTFVLSKTAGTAPIKATLHNATLRNTSL